MVDTKAQGWKPRSWHWLGAAAGFVGALVDLVVIQVVGVDMQVGGHDATVGVFWFLALTYAGMGYLVGRLFQERERERRDADTIEAQLRALERTQRELVQKEKLAAIGRVAAGIAHEVRNPLGVIRASASMVQESFEPQEDPYRACEFICEEIDRLNSLITSLLSLSRPTELRRRRVSLEKVVERALTLADDQLRTRHIDLQREIEPGAPEISADPDLVCQVVYGLVSNATEALGEGGRIVVRTEIVRNGSRPDSVWIEVADSGSGVEPGVAEHLFEPFFTTKASGTGLGLPIAERIAAAHEGTLKFVAGAGAGPGGAGACFRLQLPCEAIGLEASA
jgi:two-component system sensor histidine kinase HydH